MSGPGDRLLLNPGASGSAVVAQMLYLWYSFLAARMMLSKGRSGFILNQASDSACQVIWRHLL